MTDVRLPASGNIQLRWHAANAFANPAKPTPAEVSGGLNITDDVSWNDYDFGISASNTTNDPSLKSKSNVSDRGAMQYGGGISLYLPADFEDMCNSHAVAYAALEAPRTLGWISVQVDGELSETNVATYTGGLTQTAADGDRISLFKVMSGGYSHSITGEEAFRETISFMPQGEAYPNAIVATTLTVLVSPSTASPSVGDFTALSATVNGRAYTRGVRWTSSDIAVATVSQNGIVTAVGAGTATITATYLTASASSTFTVS